MLSRNCFYAVQTSISMTFLPTATMIDPVFLSPARQLHTFLSAAPGGCSHQVVDDVEIGQSTINSLAILNRRLSSSTIISNSHTNIKIVLSSSSKFLSDVKFWYGRFSHLFFQSSTCLTCLLTTFLIADILDNENHSKTAC